MIESVQSLARALSEIGIQRAFGIPGGGTLRLIQALADNGIPFVLTHTESAAVLMAAVDAELTSGPGLALTGLGPGAASAVNAAAHCLLDRVPVLILTDKLGDDQDLPGFHQRLDHHRLFQEVTKASLTVTSANARAVLDEAVRTALLEPKGPVHVDVARVSTVNARPNDSCRHRTVSTDATRLGEVDGHEVQRPLMIVGLGARDLPSGLLEDVSSRLALPVLTTYKGKGAFDETTEWWAGCFTGGMGSAERLLLDECDLIVSVGLDQIELLPAANMLSTPRWALDIASDDAGPLPAPSAQFSGNLEAIVRDLLSSELRSSWRASDVARHRSRVDTLFADTEGSGQGVHPWMVAIEAVRHFEPSSHVTVDAGAHMFPMCQAWRSGLGRRFWISNGLSTMAYALPSAVSLASRDREAPVLCVTGDAGLLMGLGELETVTRCGGRLTIVVFDDASMSLIRVKSPSGLPDSAVTFTRPAWLQLADGFGIEGVSVSTRAELAEAYAWAAAADHPALVAVSVDPEPYAAMFDLLRHNPDSRVEEGECN